ncbi:hypothetical protein KH172YL63_26030 [Bacillus sp. KH172YL63]|nr:hypothetical protein KH172YL63_26030 [Bacillus sp. KH172YL63]
MIIVFDKILIEDENYSQLYLNKRVGTQMVWFLILITVVAYGFVMKFVLSNVMKDQAHNGEISTYRTSAKPFSHSNLIPTETVQ